jgi:hypothetical protein
MSFEENTSQYLDELKTASGDINLSAKNRALAAGILENALQQMEAAKSRVFGADEYAAPIVVQNICIAVNAHYAFEKILAASKVEPIVAVLADQKLTPEEA